MTRGEIMNKTQIKISVRAQMEVSGKIDVEKATVPFYFEDEKGNITLAYLEAYRVSTNEYLFTKIEKFLNFYGIDDLPRIKESELLGCGQAFTLWCLKDPWLVREEIVKAIFIHLFSQEIKERVREIVESAVSDEEMKENLFALAEFYRNMLNDKHLTALYIIARLYWSEVKKEDPCWVCRLPRVRLLLTQSE